MTKLKHMYPFGEPITKTEFVNRIGVKKLDGKVSINYDHNVWGDLFNDSTKERNDEWIRHRLFDYSEALKLAEQQIIDMQKPEPFIPQDYGFVDLKIDGRTYYGKGDVSLVHGRESWHLTSGSKIMITLDLPDRRTAETVLHAMGIINLDEDVEPIVHKLQNNTLTDTEKDKICSIYEKEIAEWEAIRDDGGTFSNEVEDNANQKIESLKSLINELLTK